MDIDSKVTLLKTIADATRLRILGLLTERPRTGGELATELGLSAPTISHHLHRLRDVGIVDITPVGHYAIQPTFSDGHDSGLYTWALLHDLGTNQARYWQDYLDRLAAAGIDRDQPMPSAAAGSCGGH